MTEVKLPEIRQSLYQSLGNLIESFGYKFKKGDFTFKKGKKDNYVEIIFLFHNYSPINYSVKFLIIVTNTLIEGIKKKVQFGDFLYPTDFSSLTIFGSEFVDGVRDLEFKDRSYFHYAVATRKDLETMIESLEHIFENEVLKVCDTLLDVAGIDAFYKDRGIRWGLSTQNTNNILADLISAKLNGKRNVSETYDDIVTLLPEYIIGSNVYPSTLNAVRDIFNVLH